MAISDLRQPRDVQASIRQNSPEAADIGVRHVYRTEDRLRIASNGVMRVGSSVYDVEAGAFFTLNADGSMTNTGSAPSAAPRLQLSDTHVFYGAGGSDLTGDGSAGNMFETLAGTVAAARRYYQDTGIGVSGHNTVEQVGVDDGPVRFPVWDIPGQGPATQAFERGASVTILADRSQVDASFAAAPVMTAVPGFVELSQATANPYAAAITDGSHWYLDTFPLFGEFYQRVPWGGGVLASTSPNVVLMGSYGTRLIGSAPTIHPYRSQMYTGDTSGVVVGNVAAGVHVRLAGWELIPDANMNGLPMLSNVSLVGCTTGGGVAQIVLENNLQLVNQVSGYFPEEVYMRGTRKTSGGFLCEGIYCRKGLNVEAVDVAIRGVVLGKTSVIPGLTISRGAQVRLPAAGLDIGGSGTSAFSVEDNALLRLNSGTLNFDGAYTRSAFHAERGGKIIFTSGATVQAQPTFTTPSAVTGDEHGVVEGTAELSGDFSAMTVPLVNEVVPGGAAAVAFGANATDFSGATATGVVIKS